MPPILRAHGRQCCGGVRLCSHPPWPGCGPRVDQVSPPLQSRAPGLPQGPEPSQQEGVSTPTPRRCSADLSRRPVGSGLGVQAALAAADTARPTLILPRGAPPHPTWQQGFWEHRGAGRSQASSRTRSRSPQACKQQHGVQSQASRTRRGSFRCRSSTWEQSTARGHAGGSGAPRGPQPTRHAVGTAGSMRAWGARVCA